MRKGMFVLLVVTTVFALANAATPTPSVETQDASVAQVSEVPQAEFNFAAWAAQQADGPMCTYEPADEFPFAAERRPGGANCGGVTCGAFQYCCNPSCGICVYYGMSCTQESCF